MAARLDHVVGVSGLRDDRRTSTKVAIAVTEDQQVSRVASPQNIIAVVVARDRPEELRRTVNAVRAQSVVAELSVIIVDSSQNEAASAGFGRVENVTTLHSRVNLGGAGGYALGMLSAIASGAEWIWLMDDDGRPTDDQVLATLLAGAASRDLDAIAPAVHDCENQAQYAFPYPVGRRYVFKPEELGSVEFLPDTAHLFNGLLIRAEAIFRIGLPDLRMFIRGDEIDFVHRMRRSGLKFGTLAVARFCHPSSNGELYPVFGGRLHVVYPALRWKRRNQYRNRAYNFVKHRQFLILGVDCIRYPYFFLLRRGLDFAGLAEWLECSWDGIRGDVHVEPAIDLKPRRARSF